MTRRTWLASASGAAFALKSRKDEAKPITNEERLGRLERARELMRENRLDAIVLAGGTSLDYFTKVRWGNSERLLAFVLPRSGDPFWVVPAFEEDRAQEQISAGPLGSNARVIVWQEDESPYAKAATGLRERGVATGRIGMEETVKFVFSDGIAKSAPQLGIASATPVTAGCRAVKSPAELALMRLASSVTLEAYRTAWGQVHDGMTAQEFGALISAAHQQLGFRGGAMVLTGAGSALPHGSNRPQSIQEGSIVLIDGGCVVEGYESDISRTMTLGKPADKMRRVFDIVHRAQTTAVRTARPGLPCEAVDTAARKVIEDGGFGPGYKYFTHRVGHGLGMDGHEWPYLVKGNRQPMAAGMTFSDEPGIYIRGEFGVRLEDDMVVTADGAELMTRQSNSLESPFS